MLEGGEKMENKKCPNCLFALSVIAAVLSAVVSLVGANLWFAGSQWMLIAIVLGIWAIFLKKE